MCNSLPHNILSFYAKIKKYGHVERNLICVCLVNLREINSILK